MSDEVEEKKKKPEEAGAPLWMVTMSDMNTLLMTFFVIMFSLLTFEKNQYERLSEDPMAKSLTDPDTPREGTHPARRNESPIFSGSQPGATDLPAKSDADTSRNYVEMKTTSIDGGRVLTIGGKFDAFGEGEWRLRLRHLADLVQFLKWMGPESNSVMIRGFTAGNLADSLVKLPDGRIRPYEKADRERPDHLERSDHWLLASLRARAVRRVLEYGIDGLEGLADHLGPGILNDTERTKDKDLLEFLSIASGRNDDDWANLSREEILEEISKVLNDIWKLRKIDASRLRVRIEAYNEPESDNYREGTRKLNRRVEVVALRMR